MKAGLSKQKKTISLISEKINQNNTDEDFKNLSWYIQVNSCKYLVARVGVINHCFKIRIKNSFVMSF